MLYEFTERPDSRQQGFNPPSYVLRFDAVGEPDDSLVVPDALFRTPIIVTTPAGNLFRQDLRVTSTGWGLYLIEVPYGPRNRETGNYSFSFDTTGGTVRVTTAKEHIATYDEDGESPGAWHNGAIGVQSDGSVDGAEIVIPSLRISTTFRHPSGVVTLGHARALASVTGMTNLHPFLDYFEAGELLFLGASGSDGRESEAELAYHFAASQNAAGLSFGGTSGVSASVGGGAFGAISGVVKQGHWYLWPEFADAVHAGNKVKIPKRIHVERNYDAIDFAGVFGWS